ncbi:MAG: Thymidylate kinase [Myxococcales bacterium]|nr:Thymidylate kinase [Myxococcales bacterium]
MVDGYDVVEQLEAHQSNLTPPDLEQPATLLALPTPPILRALLGHEVATIRTRWTNAWAERLGGGDGPLPVVDLDEDARSLGTILRALEHGGSQRLYVAGARDQPGFAREIACRWSGELCFDLESRAPDLAADLANVLHDDPQRTRRLGPGSRLLVAIDDDSDPRSVVATAGGEGAVLAYARDPHRFAGANHGFLPPSALYATASGNRIREAWRQYWSERGYARDVREAALGLDSELERRLFEPPERKPATPRACVVAITGLDGSGKSSHVEALRDTLTSAGRRTGSLKLYRQGAFLELANELSARTRRGAPLASFRVSRIVKLIDSIRVYRDELQPALEGCDAVILDRYVETHRAAAASQLGWNLRHHPALAIFPEADRAFWLEVDPAEALRRLHARGSRLSADEHAVGLAGYADSFRAQSTSPADVVLDATASFGDNAARIARETLSVANVGTKPSVGSFAALPEASLARATPLAVHVGDCSSRPVLGRDIPSLASLLRRELGRGADGVAASFWVEAYAAQLVLDARTTTAASATIALWPEALHRMSCFADLHVLHELTRLLAAAVRVERFSAGGGDFLWSILAPAPAARRRLAAEYAEMVARVARERGWPRAGDERVVAGNEGVVAGRERVA